MPIGGEECHRAHPERNVFFEYTSAVPVAVNCAAGTASTSARWLKRSVKNRICTFPRGVIRRGSKSYFEVFSTSSTTAVVMAVRSITI